MPLKKLPSALYWHTNLFKKDMKLYTLALTLAIGSCNTASRNEANPEQALTQPISTVAAITPGCYRMIVGKDSATMNLSLQGDSVKGTLLYNRFEKDDNAGDFIAKVDSNKVIGWYKFQSEGVITVRQIIFKISGNKLAEAYGDVKATGDTAYFTYPHTLNYEEEHPFEKIACP